MQPTGILADEKLKPVQAKELLHTTNKDYIIHYHKTRLAICGMDQRHSNFEQLLRQAHTGDQYAARELHDLCRSHLFCVVRKRLPKKLRSKFDSEEFVQDAWTVYWQRYKNRKQIPHARAFAAFLSRIADSIVIDTVRQRLRSLRYDANREEHISCCRTDGAPDFVDPRQQTPSQVVMRREVWDHYLDSSPEIHRNILELFEKGWRSSKIAEHTGRGRRTVNRVILTMIRDISRQNEEFWSN